VLWLCGIAYPDDDEEEGSEEFDELLAFKVLFESSLVT
jgi:hypothetical protein